MVAAVDRLGPWLLDLGIGAVTWLSLAMLAMLSCRQPILRRELARVAIVGILILPALSLWPIGNLGRFDLFLVAFSCESPAASVPSNAGSLIEWMTRSLTISYLSAAVIGVGLTLLGAWALRRLTRSAVEPTSHVAELYASLPFEGRAARRPRLLVSSRVSRPVLVGGLRPVIVIPEEWDCPGVADRLRLGLLHELAHAEQWDPIFHWLGGLAVALWSALPPIWWIRRQLQVDQEFLADERAARQLGTAPSTYAASLVNMAAERNFVPASIGSGAPAIAGSGIHAGGTPLVRRVAMLIRSPFSIETSVSLGWRLGVAPIAAIVLVLVSRLTLAVMAEGARPERPGPAPMTFHVREFAVSSRQDGSPIRLPTPLPDRFALTLAIRAEPAILGEIALAGYRPRAPVDATEEAGSMPEIWHRVRLEVDRGHQRMWLDGRPWSTIREPTAGTGWLSLRPAPGRSILIRDLILSPMDGDATWPH